MVESELAKYFQRGALLPMDSLPIEEAVATARLQQMSTTDM